MAPREVSERPLDLVVSLWHGWQLAFRICWISACSESEDCCADNTDAATSAKAADTAANELRFEKRAAPVLDGELIAQ